MHHAVDHPIGTFGQQQNANGYDCQQTERRYSPDELLQKRFISNPTQYLA
jgi:hypothetical protein